MTTIICAACGKTDNAADFRPGNLPTLPGDWRYFIRNEWVWSWDRNAYTQQLNARIACSDACVNRWYEANVIPMPKEVSK